MDLNFFNIGNETATDADMMSNLRTLMPKLIDGSMDGHRYTAVMVIGRDPAPAELVQQHCETNSSCVVSVVHNI